MSAATRDQEIRRRAILVLGMHRSGTSILTRIISLLGAALPATLMPADFKNETGYWESLRVCDALEQVLKAAGSSWRDWRPFDPKWHQSPAAAPSVAALKEALVSEFGQAPLLVLKDPRICRLVPMFSDILRELGIEPCAVIVVRHPTEVVESLAKRDHMSRQEAGLSWLRHIIDAERDTRHWRRAFVDYAQVLNDWQAVVGHIGEKLALRWPRQPESARADIESILGEQHHHNRASPGDFSWTGAPWHERVYRLAGGYTASGTDLDHSAAFDEVAETIADAARPFKHYIAALESDLDECRRSTRGNRIPATAAEHSIPGSEDSTFSNRIISCLQKLSRWLRAPGSRPIIPHIQSVFPATAAELASSATGNERLRLELRRLIDSYIVCWPFDEGAYLEASPDVRLGIEKGRFASAWEHFRVSGYFEGRLPRRVEVDRDWYLATYPDVADAVHTGRLENVEKHYITHGYREGRLPQRPSVQQDWYAPRYLPGGNATECEMDFVKRGCRRGTIPMRPK